MYYFDSLKPTIKTQTNFIKTQITNVNRSKFPWLIVTAHRPMYCSSDDNDYCTKEKYLRLALEKILFTSNTYFNISISRTYLSKEYALYIWAMSK